MRHQHHRGGLRQLIAGKYIYLLLVACAICVFGLLFEISQLSSAFQGEPSKLHAADHALPAASRSSLKKVAPQIDHAIAVQCVATLTSLYEMADAPHGLHLVLFEEIDATSGDPNDASCLETFCAASRDVCVEHRARMEHKFRHAKDHVGPCPARALAEAMVPSAWFTAPKNKYYLSIDSRLEFVDKWDTLLLAEWRRAQNPHGILSIAPPALVSKAWPIDSTQSALMCTARVWTKDATLAAVDFNPPVLVKPPFKAPRLSAQYAESFHFGPIHALSAAPADAKALYVWHGDAYHRATRWWTAGYDFYAPSLVIAYAKYVPRVLHPLQLPQWDAPSPDPLAGIKTTQRQSYAHLQALHNGAANVGSKRSFKQWVAFSHVYPTAAYDMATDKQFMACNPLSYVSPKTTR
ncbi:hypothetical protein SPRG_07011 [Saprolegnia parasitica CBS 223.65]|uniref:Uncharacterized protein n=1 Tax=Saprolegnia parasitica (strain CBS 223.65) TaxID=695850 RepID=A0A067CA91_SAPPC|nr:hypothetical protein SPRG_07011 [Saprolegnia parasitica CBS 223.65]KDO27423.1 hypothetical protein SPRG_07011 [Saprolegnia parasitica CBS 223.65]|eukprot:XP_012201863.1 hypothetical protein SPRG_07011 [Saprolegnia parasitica CBS 223.65]